MKFITLVLFTNTTFLTNNYNSLKIKSINPVFCCALGVLPIAGDTHKDQQKI